MSRQRSRIIREPGGMMQTGVADIGEEGGMSHAEIRMMQILGWKAGTAGRMTREPMAVPPDPVRTAPPADLLLGHNPAEIQLFSAASG